MSDITPTSLRARKGVEPLVFVTAYDVSSARLAEAAGVDGILVGDSLGMVVLGYETTLPVTMDEMLHHARAVSRGAKAPLLVGDMPFLSYQVSTAEAVRNAGRFLAEGGMDAVKLEGGRERAETVRAVLDAGIPVMGHIGLTPQSVKALGGFRTQGRTADAAKELLDDAVALAEAGCFSIVIEGVPAPVGELITASVPVPTIGIGAGAACDGQILVWHDLLGLSEGPSPRFVKRFAEAGAEMRRGLEAYRDAVKSRAFPGPEQSYAMPPEEQRRLTATRKRPARGW